MAQWVLGFTRAWEETDFALCGLYAEDKHLGKIVLGLPPPPTVVPQHHMLFHAKGGIAMSALGHGFTRTATSP